MPGNIRQMKIQDGTDADKLAQVTEEFNALQVANFTQEELLGEIFKQLKIMNVHLSLITDNIIDKEEIGD